MSDRVGIEEIKAAEETYRKAGDKFNKHLEDALSAQATEAKEGEHLKKVLRSAFSFGFVIEAVTDHTKIRHHEGLGRHKDIYLFVNGVEPYYDTIDSDHAQLLAGEFATDVHVSIDPIPRPLSKPKGPQPEVNFYVHGAISYDEVKDISRLDESDLVSGRYIAELSAIEWRLPAPEEVAQYGAQPAQAT